jgi:hypothetical protein
VLVATAAGALAASVVPELFLLWLLKPKSKKIYNEPLGRNFRDRPTIYSPICEICVEDHDVVILPVSTHLKRFAVLTLHT